MPLSSACRPRSLPPEGPRRRRCNLLRRLRVLLRRRKFEEGLREELTLHIEQFTVDLVRASGVVERLYVRSFSLNSNENRYSLAASESLAISQDIKAEWA